MRILPLFCLVALISPLAPRESCAQNEREASSDHARVHVLEIKDGAVTLDGLALPRSNVPADLSLDGIEMTYQFSGPVTPVLEIDGEVYVLNGNSLIHMDDAAPNRANVYFLGQPEVSQPTAPASEAVLGTIARSPADASRLQPGEEDYLGQLLVRDRTLYDQIQDEQSLELETYRLAAEYRRTADRDECERIELELRDLLSQSFELKQRIRADEIEQAEAQIHELRSLVEERSARKAQIIERRLQELTGKRGP